MSLCRILIIVVHFSAIKVGEEKKYNIDFWYDTLSTLYIPLVNTFLNQRLMKPVAILALTSVTKTYHHHPKEIKLKTIDLYYMLLFLQIHFRSIHCRKLKLQYLYPPLRWIQIFKFWNSLYRKNRSTETDYSTWQSF